MLQPPARSSIGETQPGSQGFVLWGWRTSRVETAQPLPAETLPGLSRNTRSRGQGLSAPWLQDVPHGCRTCPMNAGPAPQMRDLRHRYGTCPMAVVGSTFKGQVRIYGAGPAAMGRGGRVTGSRAGSGARAQLPAGSPAQLPQPSACCIARICSRLVHIRTESLRNVPPREAQQPSLPAEKLVRSQKPAHPVTPPVTPSTPHAPLQPRLHAHGTPSVQHQSQHYS